MQNSFAYTLRQVLDRRGLMWQLRGLGLLIRLVLIAVLGDAPLVGDAADYHRMAIEFLEGEQFGTYWPPGLPLYEAAVIWMFGKSVVVARLAMLLWYVLLCRMLYGLLDRMHSRVAANLSVLILAFFPAFIFNSIEPLTQLPAATLLLAIYSLLYRYLHRRRMNYVWWMGLALGALVLVRPSAAFFLPLVPLMIFLQARKIGAAVFVAVLSVGMVSGWIWTATTSKGRLIPINEANARNFYLGNNAWTPWYKTWMYGSHWTQWPGFPEGFRAELAEIEAAPEGERTKQYWAAALGNIGAEPGMFAVRSLSRVRTFLAFDSMAGSRLLSGEKPNKVLGYVVLGLDAVFYMLIGVGWLIFVFGASRYALETRYFILSFVFLFMYSLPYFTSFSHPTYHLPIIPFFLIPACALGSHMLEKGAPRRVFKNWRFYVAFGLFIGIQIEWVIQMMHFP
ncbi:MAG: glycosyltransferase family 39 protein [Bacteroidota bacterium]